MSDTPKATTPMSALFAAAIWATAGVSLLGGAPALAAGQRLSGASSVLGGGSALGELGGSVGAPAESPESDSGGVLSLGHLVDFRALQVDAQERRLKRLVFWQLAVDGVDVAAQSSPKPSGLLIQLVQGFDFLLIQHFISPFRPSIEREQVLFAALRFVNTPLQTIDRRVASGARR